MRLPSGVTQWLSAYGPDVLPPEHGVGREIQADQLVAPVRRDVKPPELRARGDALVVAAVGDLDLAQEGVAVVDVVDADAGGVRDVEPPLDGLPSSACPAGGAARAGTAGKEHAEAPRN